MDKAQYELGIAIIIIVVPILQMREVRQMQHAQSQTQVLSPGNLAPASQILASQRIFIYCNLIGQVCRTVVITPMM